MELDHRDIPRLQGAVLRTLYGEWTDWFGDCEDDEVSRLATHIVEALLAELAAPTSSDEMEMSHGQASL